MARRGRPVSLAPAGRGRYAARMNDDLTSKIEKALALPLHRRGTLHAKTTRVDPLVIEALEAIADDSKTDRGEVVWKAIRLYLSAYQNTRPGKMLPRRPRA